MSDGIIATMLNHITCPGSGAVSGTNNYEQATSDIDAHAVNNEEVTIHLAPHNAVSLAPMISQNDCRMMHAAMQYHAC